MNTRLVHGTRIPEHLPFAWVRTGNLCQQTEPTLVVPHDLTVRSSFRGHMGVAIRLILPVNRGDRRTDPRHACNTLRNAILCLLRRNETKQVFFFIIQEYFFTLHGRYRVCVEHTRAEHPTEHSAKMADDSAGAGRVYQHADLQTMVRVGANNLPRVHRAFVPN